MPGELAERGGGHRLVGLAADGVNLFLGGRWGGGALSADGGVDRDAVSGYDASTTCDADKAAGGEPNAGLERLWGGD